MPIYNDQALGANFDPGVPPGLPTAVTVISIALNDADGDGFFSANGVDQVNGSNIASVWVGDTVTIDGVVITGVTFYTDDGSRYFTPNDGSVLIAGTATAVTFVNTSTQMPVTDLIPPCFTSGTLIATPDGEIAVEELRVGDLVLTKDNGVQILRWIGQHEVTGQGDFAPILIKTGALGNRRDLRVSPQHRMLLTDWRAELFCGESEVLCAANRLVNDSTITRDPCDEVEYFHLMFDRHEVIFAEGAPSESFLVGEYLCGDNSALMGELRELFPGIENSISHKTPARHIVRGFEGQILAN